MGGKSAEGRAGGNVSPEHVAGRVRPEVVAALDKIAESGLSGGAVVAKIKGVFPSLAKKDTQINTILGVNAHRLKTQKIDPADIVRVVVGCANYGEIKDKTFVKGLNKAIQDEIRRRQEAEKQARRQSSGRPSVSSDKR